MVDEADVRQDGNIDYKCLCSYFTLTYSIIRLFQGSANTWLEKKSTERARQDNSDTNNIKFEPSLIPKLQRLIYTWIV